MKGEVLKDFLMRLGFDLDERGMGKFTRGVVSTSTRVMGLATAAQALGGMLHAALYKIASDSAKLLDLSDATGVSVDTLEELGFVATVTGSDADKLASSIQNLNKNMAETLLGGGAGIEAFRRLGIDVRDANHKLRDTVDVLFEIGDRIKDLSPAQRSMYLSRLGIDQSLVRMLTEDVSGLRDTYRDMYAAAGVDSQQAAEQSRAYVEEVKTLKATLGLLSKSVGMAVIGRMGEDLAGLRRSIQDNFKRISGFIQGVVNILLRLLGASSALFSRVGGWIAILVDWFGQLDDGTQTLILSVGGLLAAWKLLNLGFLATPLGMILTGLLAIVAVVDDLMTFIDGGESLLDWSNGWDVALGILIAGLAAVKAAMVGIPAIMGAVSTAGTFLASVIRAIGLAATANPIGMLVAGFALAATLIIANWQTVKDWFQDFLGWITAGLSKLGKLVGGAWDTVKGWFGGDEHPSHPALAPSPALAGAVTNATALNASTVIQVDSAGSPEATARAVGAEQRNVNADLVRNIKGAAR